MGPTKNSRCDMYIANADWITQYMFMSMSRGKQRAYMYSVFASGLSSSEFT